MNIEFTLNADVSIDEPAAPRERPLEPDQVRIGDVSRICQRDLLSAAITTDADTSYEMVKTIMRKAFPELQRVVDTEHEQLPENEVRAALRAELDLLVKATWQHEQTKRRPDQDSRIAAMMGTAPRLVARWAKQSALAEARAHEEPSSRKPTAPRRKRKPKKPKK